MSRHSWFSSWRDSRNTANAPQPQEDEARVNLGIREFPPRVGVPPPEISGVGVQHVDIIAVHGLGGNWLKTWKADDGAIWLRDRLPQLLAAENIRARVLSYGYDANFIFSKTINNVEIVAGDLLSRVDSVRTTDEQKKAPIIFIAHSLGGVVVKAVSCILPTYSIQVSYLADTIIYKAINKAWAQNIDYQNIVNEAAGCVFLGVPHRGADLACLASNAATIVSTLSWRGNQRLVRAISRNSDEWKKIGSDFVFRAANLSIASFFETQRTGIKIIVDEESAKLNLPGERVRALSGSNHRNICKFGDSRDESDRFLVLGNCVTWIAESALARATPSLLTIRKLAANKEVRQSLETHPEHWYKSNALIPTTIFLQIGSLFEHDPYFQYQVQKNLVSSSLNDETVASNTSLPQHYSVDASKPQLVDTGSILWNPTENARHYRKWWRKNAKNWTTIKAIFTLLFTCLAALQDDRRAVARSKFLNHQTEMGRANCRDGELWLLERSDIAHTALENKRRTQYQVCVYRKAAT